MHFVMPLTFCNYCFSFFPNLIVLLKFYDIRSFLVWSTVYQSVWIDLSYLCLSFTFSAILAVSYTVHTLSIRRQSVRQIREGLVLNRLSILNTAFRLDPGFDDRPREVDPWTTATLTYFGSAWIVFTGTRIYNPGCDPLQIAVRQLRVSKCR